MVCAPDRYASARALVQSSRACLVRTSSGKLDVMRMPDARDG
ncbi:hypothetical protein [Sorangium sp. So ce426]